MSSCDTVVERMRHCFFFPFWDGERGGGEGRTECRFRPSHHPRMPGESPSVGPTAARRWAAGSTRSRARWRGARGHWRGTGDLALAIAVDANPFRVFTSLLRLGVVADPGLREEATHIVARPQISTPACLGAIDQTERRGTANILQACRRHGGPCDLPEVEGRASSGRGHRVLQGAFWARGLPAFR